MHDPTTYVEHPRWCDPDRCTAEPLDAAGSPTHTLAGEHQSAPLVLDTSAFIRPPRPPVTLQLFRTQTAAPSTTFAVLRTGGSLTSAPFGAAARLIEQVSALFALNRDAAPGERHEREEPPGGPLPPDVGGWSVGRGEDGGAQ
jgi:hypothetical protein